MQNSSVDTEPVTLSSITQWGYCPRRCGLILLDEVWEENEYTAEGRQRHERVHTARIEKRSDVIQLCEMHVTSRTLGITGKCDCVEAYPDSSGVCIPNAEGRYRLYPIEYKHGVVRDEFEYNMQLCAQAICLEEMFSTRIDEGCIFYINDHRRVKVCLDDELRTATLEAVNGIRDMLQSQLVPHAVPGAKCKKCSLRDLCTPDLPYSASAYLEDLKQYLHKTE